MSAQKVAKVTISLPKDLLDFADHLAEESSVSRSSIIAGLIAREEKARIQAAMAEGYREMAEENRQLAEESFPIVSDMFLQSTEWDEGEDG